MLNRYSIEGGTGYNEGLTHESIDKDGQWIKVSELDALVNEHIKHAKEFLIEESVATNAKKESIREILNF